MLAMRLRTLLFNRGILIQDIRNVGWISLGYLLCLLFSLPLQLLMAYTRENEYRHFIPPKNLFGLSNDFQTVMTFIFPVLLAIFLFRYIQVKLPSDFTHSLPIKREHLLNQHVLFGLFVLIIPVFFTAASLLALDQFLPYDTLLSVSSILNWMSITILINVFVFLAGVFVAMFTGMSVLQGALTYILFVFPVGVTVLFLTNLEFYLFGFTANYYLDQQLESIIPFIRMTQLERIPFTLNEVFIYLILSIVFYLCAMLAYKKRHAETATQAIAFETLRPIFKYGITFCTMLVGGLYFGDLQGGIGWIVFGYIAAAFLGYFLSTMILEKTWRVFSKWKGYLIYLIVVAVLGLSFQIDMFGFERKIPNVEEIQGVYFGESIHSIIDHDPNMELDHMHAPTEYIKRNYYYEELETIQGIRNLHEQIVKEQNLLKKVSSPSNSVAFRYDLKNGRQIVRYYEIPIHTYQKQYREIVESTEYKQNQNPILKVEDITSLDRITINSYKSEKQVRLTDPNDLEEFHQLLQTDVGDQTLEDFLDQRAWSSEIEYHFADNEYLHLSWKKSYTRIENWLEEKGLLAQARITAEDLSHAYVVKNEENRELYDFVYENRLEETFPEREDAIKIEDLDELEEILQLSSNYHQGDYIIGFYYKQNSYPELQTISLEHAPDFLIKKLP
jgi:ABC-2 type transport system permease protein